MYPWAARRCDVSTVVHPFAFWERHVALRKRTSAFPRYLEDQPHEKRVETDGLPPLEQMRVLQRRTSMEAAAGRGRYVCRIPRVLPPSPRLRLGCIALQLWTARRKVTRRDPSVFQRF
jgi:hypothetical protein